MWGIALTGDPLYALTQEAYPFGARRLLYSGRATTCGDCALYGGQCSRSFLDRATLLSRWELVPGGDLIARGSDITYDLMCPITFELIHEPVFA